MVIGTKEICFDMDGTIADLYSVENWLEDLRAESTAPYDKAAPMCNMFQLIPILRQLKRHGWDIRVITWLSKDSSQAFKKASREAKRAWLHKYCFPYDHFHAVQYGTPKRNVIRNTCDYAVLIDDNPDIRSSWTLGPTIDPTTQIIAAELKKLLDTDV